MSSAPPRLSRNRQVPGSQSGPIVVLPPGRLRVWLSSAGGTVGCADRACGKAARQCLSPRRRATYRSPRREPGEREGIVPEPPQEGDISARWSGAKPPWRDGLVSRSLPGPPGHAANRPPPKGDGTICRPPAGAQGFVWDPSPGSCLGLRYVALLRGLRGPQADYLRDLRS